MLRVPVRIHRLDPTLPLPAYKTSGAVACDFYARQDYEVTPGSLVRITTGVRVEIPEGYVLILAARSSTPSAMGLHIPHGMGIIDQDYREELLFQYFNPGESTVQIRRGERIGQGMFVPVAVAEFHVADELTASQRQGGFGSTGHS